MQNAEIAKFFDELADLLEIQGANSFRVRAYRNGSRSIESSADSIETLAEQGYKPLTEIPGIGDDLAKKIVTIIETGQLPQLNELRKEVPEAALKMLRIPGLGPKKVALLLQELKILSLDMLRAAAEGGKIAGIKGFGKKTEQLILEGLPMAEQAGTRVYLAEAKILADAIVADLRTMPAVKQCDVAGSCRRRRETCADLDVLAISKEPDAVMDRLAANPLVASVLARGETKQRVRLKEGMELDLRVVPEESYGAAMQYFTGSKEHNIVIRRRAQDRGLKLNEYGLFQGDKSVAGRTEEEIYEAVGLKWIPPELREDRGEIELAEKGTLPTLLEVGDMQGDLHMHTTATDGVASIAEMAEAAKERGLKYIAITDHSKRVAMANGLDGERALAHWREIQKVRQSIKGIEVLCGIECDILEDATMDLPDEVLAEAEWVIAVLHYGLKQPRAQIQKRLLTAIRNPHVSIIGHPTGRIIGRRQGADIDFDDLFKAAADHGVMMEINANPSRLDLDDIRAAAARDQGIPIVISTDSHSTAGLATMEYGVYQARRAGLTKKDVANTKPWKEFRKLLKRTP